MSVARRNFIWEKENAKKTQRMAYGKRYFYQICINTSKKMGFNIEMAFANDSMWTHILHWIASWLIGWLAGPNGSKRQTTIKLNLFANNARLLFLHFMWMWWSHKQHVMLTAYTKLPKQYSFYLFSGFRPNIYWHIWNGTLLQKVVQFSKLHSKWLHFGGREYGWPIDNNNNSMFLR